MTPGRPSLGRCLRYVLGMALLALGLTLTAQTSLGASPLTAVPLVASLRVSISFADASLLLFVAFVAAQLLLQRERPWYTLIQIPVSILFTRVMGLAQRWIHIDHLPLPHRLAFLALAIVLTGVGAAMSLETALPPCPADGFVQALSTGCQRPLGTVKNLVDITSVSLAALLSLLLFGRLEGVGPGTVLAMLGVGRVIALFRWATGPNAPALEQDPLYP